MPGRRFAPNVAALYGAASGVTPINPIPTSDWVWDADLSTIAVSSTGSGNSLAASGGTPATGGNVGFIENKGTNINPSTVALLHAVLEAGRGNPTYESDGGSGKMIQHSAAANSGLIATGTNIPAVPFTHFGLIKLPASGNGERIFGSGSAEAYNSDVLGRSAPDRIGVYNSGAAELLIAAASGAWHSFVWRVATNDSRLYVDDIANVVTAANTGNSNIPSALRFGSTSGDTTTKSNGAWKTRGARLSVPTDDAAGLALISGWLAYLNSRKPS